MILIETDNGPIESSVELLRSLKATDQQIRIVAQGEVRFEGTYAELSDFGFGCTGLAGESPVERGIRRLTHSV